MKLSIFAMLIFLLVGCGEYSAQKLVLTNSEIQGYWVASAVAVKTGFDDDETKCSIINTKTDTGEKIYPKVYLVKDREIAVVHSDPLKVDEPLVAFGSISPDGTVIPYANDKEGLERFTPTANPDQLKLKFVGQTTVFVLQRVSLEKVQKIQKIVADCR